MACSQPRESWFSYMYVSYECILFYAVHLECPDTVLIERYGGKRVDSLTGGTAITLSQTLSHLSPLCFTLS